MRQTWLWFYSWYSDFQRFLFSGLKFSAGDLFYFLLAAVLVWLCLKIPGVFFIKGKKQRIQALKKTALRLVLLLFILFIQFELSWGLNYHYRSFIVESGIKLSMQSAAEIDSLSSYLVEAASADRQKLENEHALNDKRRLTTDSIVTITQNLYRHAIPFFKKNLPGRIGIKPSLYSLPMCYLGVSGYFNPFSGEAQVNSLIPATELPFTCCHEMAHELGYGFEYEANLIGFLVSTGSNDALTRYSGHLQALIYVLPELRSLDSLSFKKRMASLPASVKTDIKTQFRFWKSYSGPIEQFSSLFYDQYLKANNQPQGMQSYSDFVPALAAYFRKFGYPSPHL